MRRGVSRDGESWTHLELALGTKLALGPAPLSNGPGCCIPIFLLFLFLGQIILFSPWDLIGIQIVYILGPFPIANPNANDLAEMIPPSNPYIVNGAGNEKQRVKDAPPAEVLVLH